MPIAGSSRRRARVALEVADNRRELDAHVAAFGERAAKIETVLKLLDELDAGVEPTIHEVSLELRFPSLNDAGWQTAERTGAAALMPYPEVQELAEIYSLQSLFNETLRPVLVATSQAGVMLLATGDPYTLPPAAREAMRARVLELKAYLELGQQLGARLALAYSELESPAATP